MSAMTTNVHIHDEGKDSKTDLALADHEAVLAEADHKDSRQLESAYVGLTRWQALRKFWKATLFCLITTFGVVMDGYQTSLPGGILANKGFIKQFGTVVSSAGVVSLNAQYVSTWSGLGYVAQFCGNYTGGLVSDRFGRRPAFWLMGAIFVLGVIVEMVAKDWRHWLVAKMLLGWGQGICQATTMTYISEIAPTQIRGSLMNTYGWGYAIGQLASAIALNTVNTTDPENYLKGIYSEWVPLGIFLLLVVFIPESPWFYARHEKEEQAKKTLTRVFGNVNGYDAEGEYAAMVAEIQHERQRAELNSQSAWRDLFSGTNTKRTFAGVTALAMQNWAGSSVVFNYTTYFFQQAGIKQPFQATVIVDSILIFSIMVSFYVVERAGRRALIVYGGGIACVLNILIGTMGVISVNDAVLNTSLAIICIWVFNYACCFAGTGWTAIGEIATPRLRAKTAAFAASTNAIAGAIYNSCVPLMISSSGNGARGWGLKTLYMFAILVGVGTALNFWLLPETKGRTFNELDEMYEAGVPPRKMKEYETTIERSGAKQH